MKHTLSILPLISLLAVALCHAADPAPPKHAADALDLVQHLSLKNDSYVFGGNEVRWQGDRQFHADCSGFINTLLMHSYGYTSTDFKKWLGLDRPNAADYHDAILTGKGFVEIKHVADARPGDVLAMKYTTPHHATGHVMLVAGLPRRMQAAQPFVTDTEQWEVTIIDSSGSGHGPTDTRHAKGSGGKDHDGLGLGVLRLYADKQGAIAGYCWSSTSGAKFADPKNEHLVLGRLVPDFKP